MNYINSIYDSCRFLATDWFLPEVVARLVLVVEAAKLSTVGATDMAWSGTSNTEV